MRLFLFFLMFAGLATSQENTPFACNLKVFQQGERRQHQKLTHEIMAAVTAHTELPRGYSFQVDPARISLLQLAEWAGREKRCCPFFNFQLDMEGGNEGKLTLTLTGRDGVKQFIRAEFEGLLPKGL